MLTEERKNMILTLLSTQNIVKSQELIILLKTSESTIRRDLQELEEAGLLKRIHGGAKSIVKLDYEPDMQEKSSKNIQEKKNIAKLAASFILDNDVIYLDAGTSTYEIIPFLNGKKIQVITNSVYHAALLADLRIPTLMIGGNIKLTTKAVVGSLSLSQLTSFRYDKAFMGINGIHLTYGFTTPDSEEAAMKAAAFAQSEQVFVLADPTKFNKVSFAKVADLVDAIILTTTLAPETKDLFSKQTIIKEVTE